MAILRLDLIKRPPEGCLGIIWFRLPVGGETFNWDLQTWNAIRASPEGSGEWETELVDLGDGLYEVHLRHIGSIASPPPNPISISWSGSEPQAWDGQRGYTAVRSSPNQLEWVQSSSTPLRNQPGGTHWVVGWVRSDSPITLIPPPASSPALR